jgi:polyisoprenoid-binding protein YceI
LAPAATGAIAADTYKIEPNHTFPSFEADHMGLSVWRGKFTKTERHHRTLDRAAKTGSVDITIDMNSIDFGHAKMNEHASKARTCSTSPNSRPRPTRAASRHASTATSPVAVDGELTLHGVTKPLKLTINKFKCIQHPMLKREVCGADASATFNRSDFGVDYGVPMGFNPEVKLAIQVEALKQ